MSRVQTLRLAELWRSRLQPLARSELRGSTPRTAGASVYEAAGWLIEGVFCGYFDPGDADVLWVRSRPLVEAAEVPEYPRFMPVVAQGVQKLLGEKLPFAAKDQMTEGAQQDFELPLFPHALMLADQLFGDRLARMCTSVLASDDEATWAQLIEEMGEVDGALVAERIGNPAEAPMDMAAVVAGFLRLLEHMHESQEFLEFARRRVSYGVDFESYLQRIGGLTAWHVPLTDVRARARFQQLTKSTWAILFVESVERYIGADWNEAESAFEQIVSAMRNSWETHHLSAAVANV
jgi:hypothetical protein